jgi:UDP-N-acetylglucosamine transferase subunit ALG13
MIFVTVGTQLPFDRLVGAVDAWAQRHPDQKVLAQTGAGRTDYTAITCYAHLDQAAFLAMFKTADVVVAHAGMGSILTAAELGKPVVIMPRRSDLGEHRNDHQSATAAKMAALSNVYVAQNAADLAQRLTQLVVHGPVRMAVPTLPATARPELIQTLRAFVFDTGRTAQGDDFDAQVAL